MLILLYLTNSTMAPHVDATMPPLPNLDFCNDDLPGPSHIGHSTQRAAVSPGSMASDSMQA